MGVSDDTETTTFYIFHTYKLYNYFHTNTYTLYTIHYYLVAVSDDTETTSDPGAPALMDRHRLGQRT